MLYHHHHHHNHHHHLPARIRLLSVHQGVQLFLDDLLLLGIMRIALADLYPKGSDITLVID